MKNWIILAVLVAMATAAVYASLYANAVPASGGPTAEFMAASLADQVARAGTSLQVECLSVSSGSGDQLRKRVHYMRSHGCLALRETSERYSMSKKIWETGPVKQCWYDVASSDLTTLSVPVPGKPAAALIEHTGGGISGTPFARGDIPDAAAYPVLGLRLYAALTHGAEIIGRETIDSHECWKLAFTGEPFGTTAATCWAWLDPATGFCPRRVRISSNVQPSTAISTVDFEGYRDVGGGVWMPAKMVIRGKMKSGADATIVIDFAEVRVDQPVPAEDASASLAPGTKVEDTRNGSVYTIP